MALQTEFYDDAHGVTHPAAYAAVQIGANDLEKTLLQYTANVFASRVAYELNKTPVASYVYSIPFPDLSLTGLEIITAMYTDLKTRAGFESAIDV